MPNDKRTLIPQARALYLQGLPPEEIAEALGVSAATVFRWKAAGRKSGNDWDALRETHQTQDPRALLAVLDQRMAEIAADREMAPTAWADCLGKVDQVRARLEQRYGGVAVTLSVLERFAQRCAERMTDDELTVIRTAVTDYLADLKRELP